MLSENVIPWFDSSLVCLSWNQTVGAISLLRRILSNITENPYETKFRRINVTGDLIRTQLLPAIIDVQTSRSNQATDNGTHVQLIPNPNAKVMALQRILIEKGFRAVGRDSASEDKIQLELPPTESLAPLRSLLQLLDVTEKNVNKLHEQQVTDKKLALLKTERYTDSAVSDSLHAYASLSLLPTVKKIVLIISCAMGIRCKFPNQTSTSNVDVAVGGSAFSESELELVSIFAQQALELDAVHSTHLAKQQKWELVKKRLLQSSSAANNESQITIGRTPTVDDLPNIVRQMVGQAVSNFTTRNASRVPSSSIPKIMASTLVDIISTIDNAIDHEGAILSALHKEAAILRAKRQATADHRESIGLIEPTSSPHDSTDAAHASGAVVESGDRAKRGRAIRIDPERLFTAVGIINDISGMMERCAIITNSFARYHRTAALALLERFKESGGLDFQFLYEVREEWQAKLDALKDKAAV